MMLTADTAQALGLKDRTNAEQNIYAGARYLAQVREKVPERIPEPDRTWLTLAWYATAHWSFDFTVGDHGSTIVDALWERRY